MKRIKLLVTSVILGTSLLVSTNVFAKDNINVKRLAGQDRYETCSKIVQDGWQGNSEYAIIVNGENFPDALSASPLAKKYNAPILLTESNKLTDTTKDQLKRLGIKNVIIIGGTGVVNSNVENSLKSMGISVKRIYGQDRFETSANVSKEIGEKGVFVVSGETYEDALSIAPISSQLGYSIILVGQNYIPDTVKNYVSSVKSNNGEVIVIGSTDVIESNIGDSLKANKIYNQSTKYERNLAIINDYKDKLNLSKLYIASDKGFADALSGSALAGLNNNPIILVGNNNQDSVNSFIKNNEKIKDINVLGGTGVIGEDLVGRIINSNVNSNNTTNNNNTSNSNNNVTNNNTNNGNTTINGNNNVVNNGTVNNITNIVNNNSNNTNNNNVGKDTSNSIDTDNNAITVDENSVVGLKQTVTIPNTLFGTYEITINDVKLSTARNQFADNNPVEVYKINYTYKLLKKGSATDVGLFLYSPFNSVDSTGEAGYNYPNSTTNDPKELKIVGSRCTTDAFIGVNNKTTSLTLTLDYNTSGGSSYVTFKIPTK